MATYSRSQLHIERVEYHVPASAPWGACWTDVYKAVAAATAELREAGLIAGSVGIDASQAAEPADDQIQISPGDDEVIVSFELRTRMEAR